MKIVLFLLPGISVSLPQKQSFRPGNFQEPGLPKKLVRSYRLELYREDTLVYSAEEPENIQRFCRHHIPEGVPADRIRITCLATWGEAYAAIYEVRAYGR